jgi:hypothetical protein
MKVDRRDGKCRECGGTLDILDGDDSALLVECEECGETYEVESDAFGDGCMTYLPAVLMEKFREGGEG